MLLSPTTVAGVELSIYIFKLRQQQRLSGSFSYLEIQCISWTRCSVDLTACTSTVRSGFHTFAGQSDHLFIHNGKLKKKNGAKAISGPCLFKRCAKTLWIINTPGSCAHTLFTSAMGTLEEPTAVAKKKKKKWKLLSLKSPKTDWLNRTLSLPSPAKNPTAGAATILHR